MEDFTLVVNFFKEIDDLFDKKLEDWDEREKILDFDVEKFDDWDEDVFVKIFDVDVKVRFIKLLFLQLDVFFYIYLRYYDNNN